MLTVPCCLHLLFATHALIRPLASRPWREQLRRDVLRLYDVRSGCLPQGGKKKAPVKGGRARSKRAAAA